MAEFYFSDARFGGVWPLSTAISSPGSTVFSIVDHFTGRILKLTDAVNDPTNVLIYDAMHGTMVRFDDAASLLLKYPNFPQINLMTPRTSGDFLTSGSGTFTMVNDAAFSDGRQVIEIVPTSASIGQVRTPLRAALDVRNGHITGWMKVNPYASGNWASGSFELRLYSTGSPSGAEPANYHKAVNRFDGIVTDGGFVKLGAHANDFTITGTGADLSAITWASWTFRAAGATAVAARVSDMQFVPNPRTKAAVIFRWDDAWKSTSLRDLFISVGAPMYLAPGAVASSNGFNGAGYNTPPTNNPSRWSIDEVIAMRALGWQVGTQAYDTENNQPDQASYLAQFQSMQDYYRARGWVSDASDGTYYSNVNFNTQYARQSMLEKGSATIQRFNNGRNNVNPPIAYGETFPFRDETCIQTLNLAAPGLGPGLVPPITTTTDSVTVSLNQTIANKGVLIIAGHNDLYEQQAELDAINYVLNRWIAGGKSEFDITTPKALLDPYRRLYGTRSYVAPNY